MTLMSRTTGKDLGSDLEHLKQSIIMILETPVGTRPMVRDFGSRLYQYIDRPINDELLVDVFSAVVEALDKWEPRFKVDKVSADTSAVSQGKLTLQLEGIYLPVKQLIRLSNVSVTLRS